MEAGFLIQVEVFTALRSKNPLVDVAFPVKPGLIAEIDIIKRSDRPTIGIEKTDDPFADVYTLAWIRRQQLLNQRCAIQTHFQFFKCVECVVAGTADWLANFQHRRAPLCISLCLNFVQFLWRQHVWRMASSWQWQCAMRMKLVGDPLNSALVWHLTVSVFVHIPLLHGSVRWHLKIMFDHEYVLFCTQWNTNHHSIQQKTARQLFHQRCNSILNRSLTLPLIQLCRWNRHTSSVKLCTSSVKPSYLVGETVVPHRWNRRNSLVKLSHLIGETVVPRRWNCCTSSAAAYARAVPLGCMFNGTFCIWLTSQWDSSI